MFFWQKGRRVFLLFDLIKGLSLWDALPTMALSWTKQSILFFFPVPKLYKVNGPNVSHLAGSQAFDS